MKQLNNTNGSVFAVRQQLQQQSMELAARLQRSVSRAASVDHLPCEEYGAEVAQQHTLAEELLFIQHSRSALERAVAHGSSRLLWRWQDGSSSEVHFRRENSHISMRVRQKSA